MAASGDLQDSLLVGKFDNMPALLATQQGLPSDLQHTTLGTLTLQGPLQTLRDYLNPQETWTFGSA